jgi:hypothetical protein
MTSNRARSSALTSSSSVTFTIALSLDLVKAGG